nr:type II toxin-antitoxin system prevent-host-death family antitoxin [Frankia sp. Cr2]
MSTDDVGSRRNFEVYLQCVRTGLHIIVVAATEREYEIVLEASRQFLERCHTRTSGKVDHAPERRPERRSLGSTVDLVEPGQPSTGGRYAKDPCRSPTRDVQFSVRTISCTNEEDAMRTMTYSESRARYAEVLTAVTDDREEVVITRAGHEPVVIVSLDDYQSLKETAYLLRSPENARRLLIAIDRLESGGGVVRNLAE